MIKIEKTYKLEFNKEELEYLESTIPKSKVKQILVSTFGIGVSLLVLFIRLYQSIKIGDTASFVILTIFITGLSYYAFCRKWDIFRKMKYQYSIGIKVRELEKND